MANNKPAPRTLAPLPGFLYGDYNVLPNSGSTQRPSEWYWDDIVLTVIMVMGGIQDLIMGALYWLSPQWVLEDWYSHDTSSIDILTLTLFEDRGVALVEAGIAATLITIYRTVRWYKIKSFNGVIFQITFLVNTVGRSLLLARGVPASSNDMDPGFYMLVGRLALSSFALLLSLWSFRNNWSWLVE
jgi:hypothetical protein